MENQKYKEEYIRRIHKVEDYIEKHLSEPLSVEELAKVAGFSQYHFSRIFQSVLQESLAHYVNRKRMEQTLFLLAHREDQNMTDIAYELGYTDSAVFSRAFKNYYGISPREYRKEYSKNCKEPFLLSEYNKDTAKKEAGNRFPVTGEITIEHLNQKKAIYVRHTGTYDALAKEYSNLLEVLLQKAKEQDLLNLEENWLFAIYHDNPEFSEEKQFRTSLCLTIPEHRKIKEDGILGVMTIEDGLYAVGHFSIKQEQYPDAWNYMYREWIMGSGYAPRNSYPFEVYCNNPDLDENHMHEVDIYVPIEPLTF